MPLTSTIIHRYSDCPSMRDGDTTHGDHQFEDELPQVSCPACREYLGLDPLPDVADRLYDAYINATADTFLSVDDENAIKDAYNEIRRLRAVIRTYEGV